MTIYIAPLNASTEDKVFAGTARTLSGTGDNVIIQAALDDTDDNEVVIMEGLVRTSETLLMPSSVLFRGTDKYLTTIKASDTWAPSTAFASYGGHQLISNSAARSNITIRDMTIDHNAGSWAIASGRGNSHVLDLHDCSWVTIERIKVQFPDKYSIHLQSCTDFRVTQCHIESGRLGAAGFAAGIVEQDGIHLDSVQRGEVTWNHVDTGLLNEGGDDAIALLTYSNLLDNQDVVIAHNIITSAEAGVALYANNSGVEGPKVCKSCQVSNNSFVRTTYSAIRIGQIGSGGTSENSIINGNTIRTPCQTSDGAARGAINVSVHPTPTSSSADGLQITNNTIDGTGTNTTAGMAYAIHSAGVASNVTISGNTVIDWPAEDFIRLSQPVSILNITNNVGDLSAARTTANGIYTLGATNGTIALNTIIGQSSANATVGYDIHGATSKTSTGLIVTNNRFTGFGTGIKQTNDNAGTVLNNQIDLNHLLGCTIATSLDVSTLYDISNKYTVEKSADTTIAANTLNQSTLLSFSIGANERWFAEINLHASKTGSNASGFHPKISAPAGLTGRYHWSGPAASGIVAGNAEGNTTLTTATTLGFLTNTTGTQIGLIRGVLYLVNGATAGTVTILIDTTTTLSSGTIHAGSFMRLDRVV